MQIWLSVLAVAGGGALGALARIALTEVGGSLEVTWGVLAATLVVNTTGSLVLGILRGMPTPPFPPAAMAGLGAGFLGGFTTWSSVVDQSVILAGFGPVEALSYLALTVFLALTAAWVGLAWGSRIQSANPVTS